MDNLCKDYPIVRMASVFKVHRGGYYKWAKHPLTQRELKDIELTRIIKRIFVKYKERYGSPLKRGFNSSNPNQIWTSDLTYIKTRGGWLYLCVILYLFSRKIVGWSMDKNMQSSMFIRALNMAKENRLPESPVIFYSNRGVQYASNAFRKKLTEYNLVQSMSRPGNCLDNAPSESFFHTLKVEEVYGQRYETRQEA